MHFCYRRLLKPSVLLACLLLSFWYYDARTTSSSHAPTRIMYVIRTGSQFYETRLVHLLHTWVALVANDVFFVTDAPLPNIPDNRSILTRVACGHDAHSLATLCCKTAHDFLLFRRVQSAYDWFCHFDDDQYVHVDNLLKYLSTLDSNRSYYIGRNSWPETLKRSKEPFPYPFWFATLGAGVCLSKDLVQRLEPYTQQVHAFVDGCIRENYHDDIYLGFLISAYINVTLTRNRHFHSHLEDDLFGNRQLFLQTFTQQITFGFRLPDRYPDFLPRLFEPDADPFRMRTLHCLLYPHATDCRARLIE